MIPKSQIEKARRLLELHHAPEILVLPNVWDPIGARVLERSGFPAVATASAAISASFGYSDGQRLNRSTMLAAVKRIASATTLPVTADMESGYGDTLDDLADTVRGVVEAGAVGMNLEDSIVEGKERRPIEEQCERIRAARGAAQKLGVHVVINARIDSFCDGALTNAEAQLQDAVERAASYRDAGADCVYPMGPCDLDTVAALRARIHGPINILATADAPSTRELQNAGINRVSFGPFLFRSCLQRFRKIVDEIRTAGESPTVKQTAMPGDDVAAFLDPQSES